VQIPPVLPTAWPPCAQWATAFLLGVTTALLAVQFFTSTRAATRPADLERGSVSLPAVTSGPGASGTTQPPRAVSNQEVRPGEVIDINRASLEELQRLPAIGPKLSQRIVDARQLRPFRTVDELRRVPGIGPKTMEKVRPFVIVGEVPK
jgi:competence protein ComEA